MSIAYNLIEAVVSLAAGILAGSVALTGFGIDSVIEVTTSSAAQWRLRADADEGRRERAERVAHRIIGWCFLALALYVALDSARSLWFGDRAQPSVAGIAILALSVVVMPLLARAKLRVANEIGSGALRSESAQTSLCAYLSAIALAGVVLNAVAGWWWADPVAGLAMAPIIAKEGFAGVSGDTCGDDCD